MSEAMTDPAGVVDTQVAEQAAGSHNWLRAAGAGVVLVAGGVYAEFGAHPADAEVPGVTLSANCVNEPGAAFSLTLTETNTTPDQVNGQVTTSTGALVTRIRIPGADTDGPGRNSDQLDDEVRGVTLKVVADNGGLIGTAKCGGAEVTTTTTVEPTTTTSITRPVTSTTRVQNPAATTTSVKSTATTKHSGGTSPTTGNSVTTIREGVNDDPAAASTSKIAGNQNNAVLAETSDALPRTGSNSGEETKLAIGSLGLGLAFAVGAKAMSTRQQS